MASRKLDDLYSPLENVIKEALLIAKKRNLPILITCTQRSPEEQKALYAQGRESLTLVNHLRLKVGLPAISKITNKRKITWTSTTYHSTLPKAMAVDFAISDNNKVYWDLKTDINTNHISDYKEFATICKSLNSNIEWGGDWNNTDPCHIQWKNGLNINQEEPIKEVEKEEPIKEVEKEEPIKEKEEPIKEVEKEEPIKEVEKPETTLQKIINFIFNIILKIKGMIK